MRNAGFWLAEREHGFYFFPAGPAWDSAYAHATDFLRESLAPGFTAGDSHKLLLGPKLPRAGYHHLMHTALGEGGIAFGRRIIDWKSWVVEHARASAIGLGEPFQEFTLPARREFLRNLLTALDGRELLGALSGLWREERLFTELLDTLEELRLAGFADAAAIEFLWEALANRGVELEGAAKADLWKVVNVWNGAIETAEEGLHDYPRALQVATLRPVQEESLFLLGFERLHLLEQEALRSVARSARVYIPLPLGAPELREALAGRNPPDGKTATGAWATARLLAGHSDIPVHFLETEEKARKATELEVLPCLTSATPLEECRAAAALVRSLLAAGDIDAAQIVASPDFFGDERRASAFRTGLGADTISGLRNPRSGHSRVFLQICQSIEIVTDGYPLAKCLEFADLLATLTGDASWRTIPELALRAGIDEGLGAWEEFAGEVDAPEVADFLAALKALGDRFPARAAARAYHESLVAFLGEIGYAEVPRNAPDNSTERIAHAAVSLALKAAALLGTHTENEFALADWLAEWRLVIDMFDVADENAWSPLVGVFRYGEWLPPASDRTLRLFLGAGAGSDPPGRPGFLLREGDRLSLSDWGLAGVAGDEADHFAWIVAAVESGIVAASRSLRDEAGKDLAHGLIATALPVRELEWPSTDGLFPAEGEAARPRVLGGVQDFQIPARVRERTSPTLIDDWRDCGFRALVAKVWRVSDGLRATTLDPSPLSDGTLVHRTLELFYEKEKGRSLTDPDARSLALGRAFAEAEAEVKLEYFRGGKFLREVSRAQMRRRLERFVEAEAGFFTDFPLWTDIECEREFLWKLPSGKPLKGTVDRVDRDPSSGRFLVTDYKTGSSPPKTKDVIDRKKLQLPLYLAALAAEGAGEPVAGFYLKTQPHHRAGGLARKRFNKTAKNKDTHYFKLGGSSGALLEDEEFSALLTDAVAEAERRALAMDAGEFPVRPDDPSVCERCPVRPACRIRDDYVHASSGAKASYADFRALLGDLRALRAPESEAARALQFSGDQERALAATGKLTFLEASAGSGKTTILVEKYTRELRRIAAERKITARAAADRILAASFTEKSAEEIRERLAETLAREFDPGVAAQAGRGVATIHGFCRRVIGDFAHLAGVDPYGEVLDEPASRALFHEVAARFFANPPEDIREDFVSLYGIYRRRDVENILLHLMSRRSLLEFDRARIEASLGGDAEAAGGYILPEGAGREATEILLRVFDAFTAVYDERKLELAALDFNDLERLAWRILLTEEASAHYRGAFDLVMVDEFQDTNALQRAIVERVAAPGLANVFVVGDAKQSIYRFRAADVSVFQDLRMRAAETGIVCQLDANYRSQSRIVDFANRLSAAIFPAAREPGREFEAVFAHAEATRPPGDPVNLIRYEISEEKEGPERDSRREVESGALARLIRRLADAGQPLGGIAVLFRGVTGNELYLKTLQSAGIPYSLANRGRFWTNQTILDGVSLLRSLVDGGNFLARLALLRSPWFQLAPAELDAVAHAGAEGIAEFFRTDARAAWWRALEERVRLLSLADLLAEAFARYPGYSNRFERLQMEKLVALVAGLEHGSASKFVVIGALSEQAGWEAESDSERQTAVAEPAAGGAVQILTVHAAKGLQFDVVILCDVDGKPIVDSPPLRHEPGVGLALKSRDEGGEWEKGESYDELSRRSTERDLAESKRLLYVAATRAKRELYIFLGPARKAPTWGEWLRAADFGDSARDIPLADLAPEAEPATRTGDARAVSAPVPPPPTQLSRVTSISELSAFVFCSEFHRLKYVQRWEDSVVELWPAERLPGRTKGPDPARALLRELGLTKKDRGIALHRLLERAGGSSGDRDVWRGWLLESYRNQGADSASATLADLIETDVALVEDFLASPVGRELFAEAEAAYPELGFIWERDGHLLSGAIDRVVRARSGEWIVADYKTASLEGGGDRYTFQVQGYMAALARALERMGEAPRIKGWLIDLFSGKAIQVEPPDRSAWARSELGSIEATHAGWRVRIPAEKRGVRGTEACTVCGYASHCTLGRQYVLNFSAKSRSP